MFRIKEPSFITFVDLKKAFGIVNWVKLFKVMEAIGIDYKDRIIIYNLYINKTPVIKAEKGNNYVEAKIAKKVR